MADFGKLNFSVAFNPTSAFPLDARCYFESLTLAEEAAATAEEVGSTNTVYYVGQRLLVVENGEPTWYVIQSDKSLKADGTATSSGSGLPTVSKENDGQILKVVDGKWQAANLPVYDGAYEVTPSASNEQVLNTSQTYMDADVKVKKIPYAEVLNDSGGNTVTIG